MYKMYRLLFIIASLTFSISYAQAEAIKLTSLDWPPYSGKSLTDQGTSAKSVKDVFAAAGLDTSFEFLPWNRAVAEGLKNPEFVGYFPEYYSEGLDAEKSADGACLFSDSFGTSPVGFVQSKNKPMTWSTHNDLKNFKIGVVSGYVNEAQFDKMVADGDLKVEEVSKDILNIRKVAQGRLSAGVIDSNVLNYLLDTDKSMAKSKDSVEMNGKLLTEHGLHICFPNTETGKKVRISFNKALAAR